MTARPLALAAVLVWGTAAAAQPPAPPPYPDPVAQLAALRDRATSLERDIPFCERNYRMYQERFERDPLTNSLAGVLAIQWHGRMKTAERDLDAVQRRIRDLERAPRR